MSELTERSLDALVARINKLERQARARAPQLGRSSMEGGQLTVYQPGTGGLPGAIVGEQYDGTFGVVPVGGPTPPKPVAPTMEAHTSGVLATVGGEFVQTVEDRAAGRPTVAPLDFARFELQVSDSPDFPTGPSTRGGHYITTAAGGGVFVPWSPAGTSLYARARCWSKAGKFSPWSTTAGPVEAGKIGVADLGFDISSLAGNRIHFGTADPTADPDILVSYGDLWLKEIDPGPPPVYQTWRWTPAQGTDPDRWVLLADQDASAALAAAVAAQQAADAKATVFHQTTKPTWSGPAGSAMWFDTDDGNRPYRWNGTDFTDARLGNGAITPQSLVASDLFVPGTVSAGLLEAIMVITNVIIAGDPNGLHARLTPQGLKFYRPAPDGGLEQVGQMGGLGDFLSGGNDGTGRPSWAIDNSGASTFASITSRAWPQVGSPDHTGRGGSLLEILDRRGRGIVQRGSNAGVYDCNTSAGRGIFDITAKLYYGRLYKIGVKCRINGVVANDALAEVQVRYTQSAIGSPSVWQPAPDAPTINSLMAAHHQTSVAHPVAQGVSFDKPFSLGGVDDGRYRIVRFLLCLARPVGSSTITMYGAGADPTEMWVEDVGPYIPNTATVNDGGGTVQNPGPPPAPQTQRFTRSWVCTWHQNFLPSGAQVALVGASQGRDPYNGNMRSYLGFSGVATDGSGATMDDLIGSVIESLSVYLYSWHWYSWGGGEPVIGMHGFRNPAPGGYGGGNEWMVGGQWFQRPDGRYVDLSPAGYANWQSGVWKGILLGATSGANNDAHYGRFTDETDPYNKPVITATYRK